MKSMSRREQAVAVVAVVFAAFYVLYNWAGLGSTLDLLGSRRQQLSSLRSRCEDHVQALERYREITEEYESYANYSLLEAEGDPADVFSNYVFNTLVGCGIFNPRLSPTESEEIEDVPNYVQILLPVEFQTEFDLLVRALGTFDRQRLLIRALEVRSTEDDSESPLNVKLTLTRFVRIGAAEDGAGETGG